ncbi:MAG: glycosyltransferase family 4 protein [Candidatus Dormibacteria bacterium]
MSFTVGLDARFASARYDGVGRYVAALAEELPRADDSVRLIIVPPPDDDPPSRRLPAANGRVRSLAPRRARRAESPWALWEMPWLARRAAVDVWHTPFPLAAPQRRPPLVVTLHDCIPERFPSYFGTARRLAYLASVSVAVRAARVVVVPSQMTADDAQRFHRVPASRIRVIPEGVSSPADADDRDDAEMLRSLAVHEPYVLTVGRPRPHKNYTTVVRALSRIDARRRPLLVRVGRDDPRLRDGSSDLAAALGVRLLALEGVSDAALHALYRRAALVAIPSAVEGFGLPLLEALACGAPVLARDIQPLCAAGDGVAQFVAGGIAVWASAIEGAIDDRAWHERARRDGPQRAAMFPWRRTAEQTLAAYREVAA